MKNNCYKFKDYFYCLFNYLNHISNNFYFDAIKIIFGVKKKEVLNKYHLSFLLKFRENLKKYFILKNNKSDSNMNWIDTNLLISSKEIIQILEKLDFNEENIFINILDKIEFKILLDKMNENQELSEEQINIMKIFYDENKFNTLNDLINELLSIFKKIDIEKNNFIYLKNLFKEYKKEELINNWNKLNSFIENNKFYYYKFLNNLFTTPTKNINKNFKFSYQEVFYSVAKTLHYLQYNYIKKWIKNIIYSNKKLNYDEFNGILKKFNIDIITDKKFLLFNIYLEKFLNDNNFNYLFDSFNLLTFNNNKMVINDNNLNNSSYKKSINIKKIKQ